MVFYCHSVFPCLVLPRVQSRRRTRCRRVQRPCPVVQLFLNSGGTRLCHSLRRRACSSLRFTSRRSVNRGEEENTIHNLSPVHGLKARVRMCHREVHVDVDIGRKFIYYCNGRFVDAWALSSSQALPPARRLLVGTDSRSRVTAWTIGARRRGAFLRRPATLVGVHDLFLQQRRVHRSMLRNVSTVGEYRIRELRMDLVCSLATN